MALIEIVSKFRMVLSHDTKVRKKPSLDVGKLNITLTVSCTSVILRQAEF